MKRADITTAKGHRTSGGSLARSMLMAPDTLLALGLVVLVLVPGVLSGTAWALIFALVAIGAALRAVAMSSIQANSPSPADALKLMFSSLAWLLLMIALVVAVADLADVWTAVRVLLFSAACHGIGTLAATGMRINRQQLSLTPFFSTDQEPWK